ncbi:hypothetical protein QBC43DRAFT_188148, partial [Cladorrhinum sp. PSN259]
TFPRPSYSSYSITIPCEQPSSSSDHTKTPLDWRAALSRNDPNWTDPHGLLEFGDPDSLSWWNLDGFDFGDPARLFFPTIEEL